MNKPSVLIAESDLSFLTQLSSSFGSDFIVHAVGDGMAAWEILQEFDFDCLVTCVDMPGLDGIELLEKMRGSAYKNKVIVSTGRHCADTRLRCEKLGISAYLQKPFDAAHIVKMIRAMANPEDGVISEGLEARN